MTWADEYREIVEFYWWEPQMIGRSLKNYHKFGSADEMWESVSKKEVPLNHVLNVFFALFPLEKLNLGLSPSARAISSRELEALYRNQRGATQPDIFIEDIDSNIGIELKTTTKSSRQQLEKYVAFSRKVAPDKRLRMVMLTPYDDPGRVFKDDISDVDCQIDYLSFRTLCDTLDGLTLSNDIERKLAAGVVEYMKEYFPDWT